MSVEELDDSSGSRGTKRKRLEAKANFQKHQNFSMMVEDRKPIGGSNEDTFFTKGDSLRSKYKKQMNTIYLGSERDLENVEAVHEADEEDDPSPTAIMGCIAQLDNRNRADIEN